VTLARLVASGGSLGDLPRAPGTWASMAAVVVGTGLLAVSPWALAAGVVAATAAGLWAIPRAGGTDDPGWVVIDEVAGQWLAMLGLAGSAAGRGPAGWGLAAGLAAAFAVFRALDVAKPGPVGWADRHEGAAWVMGDDLIAGGIAAGVLLAGRGVAGWAFGE